MPNTNSNGSPSLAAEPATFTAREFAAAINSSYGTVLRLIKRRKIRCLPLRHKRIPRTELERFLREESVELLRFLRLPPLRRSRKTTAHPRSAMTRDGRLQPNRAPNLSKSGAQFRNHQNNMKENSNQSEIDATFGAGLSNARKEDGEFNQKRAAALALACIAKMKKPDGTFIELSPEQVNAVTVVYYPTKKTRLDLITDMLKAADGELDEATAGILSKLFNPQAIEAEFKAMNDPAKRTLRDFMS